MDYTLRLHDMSSLAQYQDSHEPKGQLIVSGSAEAQAASEPYLLFACKQHCP